MLTPYVQDVAKWISYYNRNGTSNSNVAKPTESLYVSDNVGLAQESNMSVSKVEPRGAPPKAPDTGPSASLQNVTPSHESVVQAAYTAKRDKIQMTQSKGRPTGKGIKKKRVERRSATKSKKKKVKHKKTLFGTPSDIFKVKNSFKNKKKNK